MGVKGRLRAHRPICGCLSVWSIHEHWMFRGGRQRQFVVIGVTAFLASDSSYAGSLHPGDVAGIAGIATNLLDQPAGAFRDSYHMPASRQIALGVGKLADPAFGSVRNAPVSAGSSYSATNATRIKNLRSQRQTLRLSCESRSASDWAAFFGVTIDELTFFDQLPKTDNPETGFVGDVNDPPGNLPPRGYGVHAKPVAALLQAYGLPAEAQRGMSVDMLESEIAAGRPVIVWTTGFRRSKPVVLTDSSGTTYVAARFEHTLIVVGYNRTSFVWSNVPGYTRQVSGILGRVGQPGDRCQRRGGSVFRPALDCPTTSAHGLPSEYALNQAQSPSYGLATITEVRASSPSASAVMTMSPGSRRACTIA